MTNRNPGFDYDAPLHLDEKGRNWIDREKSGADFTPWLIGGGVVVLAVLLGVGFALRVAFAGQ